MFSLLRSMENSSNHEEFERLSRMVENERLMELGSVTTWKHEPPTPRNTRYGLIAERV